MIFPTPQPASHFHTVRLSEVISALTYALDLTGGQRPGHTLRTASICMRIGNEIGLSNDALGALYYAALLKDAGCSSNAARMAAMFGAADQTVKRELRLVDWHDRWRMAMRTARTCGAGHNPIARIKHFLRVAGTPELTRELIALRCERGAQIAVALGFPMATSEAIAHVDEHWCGLGYPVGLAGEQIPILSRVLLLAQTFEAFWVEYGVKAALQMLHQRAGRSFDPALVKVVATWRTDAAWWASLADSDQLDASVIAMEPGSEPIVATEAHLDATAYAFAAVVDAKTPFTYRHSTNVARYAMGIAQTLGADDKLARTVLRAGLLHDIGKLGVSNRILDKPDRLTDAERTAVNKHPRWTLQILERVSAFEPFASAAAQHHERLDGQGYPWGLGADNLDFIARVLAIADVYEAMTADRPYRGGMAVDKVIRIMEGDRGTAFDGQLLDVAIVLAETGAFLEMSSSAGDQLQGAPSVSSPVRSAIQLVA